MTLREKVARELEKWRCQIVNNEPRNGPLKETDVILALVEKEKR